ncbi:MAG: 2-oxoacid:acceptor oxidoreductase subunit alpha [Candidatus Cloacimonetes bacterium]|nr:2-oxoacid:acceptor oxidoreductase subunit alpha [Candidatus Cloacimonadota bacterium]MCF7813455.1 2-oxoacid:acceptor oxidoreductase subunit alpha [Candidatus Cloacimonadota bacterium]MCF7867748.1 2-oxoacid:acceptor oxidoreductase subunit alpha [Candidatus Cloacimonadota bacterium]MCF7883166.1 2-oxoacid:acceptor oxidoreductase subunit alpha [Candidatus Cloacimonadota bacterium]
MVKEKTRNTVLMQGNEAIARGTLDAGLDFFAGYPITPSTEIAELCSRELPKRGGKFIQMEDEIASISAIIGASLAGAKTMTATSGPGFSLMTEGIGFAKMTETPCVVVNVMRGGPSTGSPTKPSQADIMQSRWGNHGDAPAIVLYPNSVKESYELAIRAMNLAEKYRTCVVLLSDEVLGHMRETIELPDLSKIKILKRIQPSIPPEWYKHYPENPKYPMPMASFGEGYRYHVTGLAHDSNGFPTNLGSEVQSMSVRLQKKIVNNIDDIVQIESFQMDDAKIAIFAAGITSRAAKEAVVMARRKGVKVGMLRPLTIWPFPDRAVKKYLGDKKAVIVPELNEGQLSNELKRVMGGIWNYDIRKTKNIIEIQKFSGQLITPDEILATIKEVK